MTPPLIPAAKLIPILIDGGFRRGTDIFKALALGADAVGIGRPYLWGLSAFGQDGIEKVLDILQFELVRTMKFSGTTTLNAINSNYIQLRNHKKTFLLDR